MSGLARTVAVASRCLLLAPERDVPGSSLFDRVIRSIKVLLHG
jgi:hypothetical protein